MRPIAGVLHSVDMAFRQILLAVKLMMHEFSPFLLAQSSFSTTSSFSESQQNGNNNGADPIIPMGGLAIGIMALLSAAAMGWQFCRTQQKIKQLRHQNLEQEEKLQQTKSTLQDYLNSPDLKASKILALDYLRMRLDEEVFRYQIIHQIEDKLSRLLSQLVNAPPQDGVASNPILQDCILDIEYDLEGLEEKWHKSTVLRLHVQLRKLPIQSTSNTVKQMVEAITLFANHPQGKAEWKTPLQQQWLVLRWEASNHPLPLLNVQNYPAQTKDAYPSSRQHNGFDGTPTQPQSHAQPDRLTDYVHAFR